MTSRESIGLPDRPRAARHLGVGFLLGFASLATAAVTALLLGGRTLNLEPTFAEWMRRTSSAIVTAGVVAVLEEVLFRGAIFGSFLRAYSLRTSLLVSSGIFGAVHFLERPASPVEVQWWSGFATLGAMFGGFLEPWKLMPGLLNLVLVGGLLALAYHRTSNLYFPIGIHAGWVFCVKMYGFGTRSTPSREAVVGSGRLFDGWLALIVLAALVPVIHFLIRREVSRGCERARVVDREPVEPVV